MIGVGGGARKGEERAFAETGGNLKHGMFQTLKTTVFGKVSGDAELVTKHERH